MNKILIVTVFALVACAKTKQPTKGSTPFQTSLKKAIEHQQSVVDAYSDSASFCKADKLLYYGEQMEMACVELKKLKKYER